MTIYLHQMMAQIAEKIRPTVDKYQQAFPALLEIPSKDHPYGKLLLFGGKKARILTSLLRPLEGFRIKARTEAFWRLTACGDPPVCFLSVQWHLLIATLYLSLATEISRDEY